MSNQHLRNNQPEDMAARFRRIEDEYTYHHVVGAETINAEDLPVFVRLGKQATDTLAIVNPRKDLEPTESTAGRWYIDGSVHTLIIDPDTYDLAEGTGYKGLRDGESVLFGRAHTANSRFEPFSSHASREHVRITQSPDGTKITIEDLASKNGTYVGKLAVGAFDTETLTETSQEIEAGGSAEKLYVTLQSSTIASERHPEHNEDSMIADTNHNIYGVFDGMGGHANGEAASRQAVVTTTRLVDGLPKSATPTQVGEYLEHMLLVANEDILRSVPGGGTTAVLAHMYSHKNQSGEAYASIASVGDSRVYLWRDGHLRMLTVDHSVHREDYGTDAGFKQQELLATTDSLDALSAQDQRAFQHRNVVSSALGLSRGIAIDVRHVLIQPADHLVLTTDGIHDNLTTAEIAAVLADSSIKDYAGALTQAALARSRSSGHVRAKRDDMTALVVHLP